MYLQTVWLREGILPWHPQTPALFFIFEFPTQVPGEEGDPVSRHLPRGVSARVRGHRDTTEDALGMT